MHIFQRMRSDGLEQLIFCHDEAVGLRAIIAIHNTALGPALAEVRMLDHADEEAAMADAINNARAMTYRTALADCDLGGGCVVLWGAPTTAKSEAYFRAFGRFLERFPGLMYAVLGVGTDSTDLHNIRRETDKVLALTEEYGGIADVLQMTADGLFQGLKATVRELSGATSFEGLSFLVQGLGRLGSAMVERLAQAKATLIVTDLNYDRIKNVQDRYPNVTMVRPDDAYQVRCDVVVPCAPCNDVTLERVEMLKCRAIDGAASFVVPTLEVADRLHQRSILYMPHFVTDAGGTIQADFERKGLTGNQLRAAVEGIYRRTRGLYEAAREAGESPFRTALRLAQSRLTAIGDIGRRNAL